MRINTKIINKGLCVSCGLCTYENNAEMVIKKGIYIPRFNKSNRESDEFLLKICPGKGYNITSIGNNLYGTHSEYDYRLGYYTSIGAAHTFDKDILKQSSSGGMIVLTPYFLDIFFKRV